MATITNVSVAPFGPTKITISATVNGTPRSTIVQRGMFTRDPFDDRLDAVVARLRFAWLEAGSPAGAPAFNTFLSGKSFEV